PIVVLLSLGCRSAKAPEPAGPAAIESAEALFPAGKFAEAGKIYAQIAARDPGDYPATVRLGNIALLANRFDEAQKWLEKAVELKPDSHEAKALLEPPQ